MALFSRIFQGKKTNRTPTSKWYTSEVTETWSEPEFIPEKVRLVLYRDQDFKGRSLLFDSKAVHRVDEQNEKKTTCRFAASTKKQSNESQDENGAGSSPFPKYSFSRAGSDIKMLEEMVFGAVGMAFRGSTLKVHTLRTPPRVMVTKVFIPSSSSAAAAAGRGARDSSASGSTLPGVDPESLDYSLNCSSTDLTSPQKIASGPEGHPAIAQSVPMDVPSPPKRHYDDDDDVDVLDDDEHEDSGFSTSAASSLSSWSASVPRSSSSSSVNSSSLNSMTRRWRRNQQTSLEHSFPKRHSDEGVYEQPAPPAKRPSKFGMAVVISLPEDNEKATRLFQDFFFSHVTLIEGHIIKLKGDVERAIANRKNFVPLMVEALEGFRELMSGLYLTPRLPEPVWLNMMCYTTRRVSLCQRFLRELMFAVAKYDTKQTKFFLSTLITGVLTHHLAWVPTVAPAGATPSRTYLDKHSAKWLDAVAKSHPYNPLWAQLGDLYGAIGFPLRLSRTIVVGRKADMVHKFLYILSYFIRCSEVLERSEHPHDFDELFDDAAEAGETLSYSAISPDCASVASSVGGRGENTLPLSPLPTTATTASTAAATTTAALADGQERNDDEDKKRSDSQREDSMFCSQCHVNRLGVGQSAPTRAAPSTVQGLPPSGRSNQSVSSPVRDDRVKPVRVKLKGPERITPGCLGPTVDGAGEETPGGSTEDPGGGKPPSSGATFPVETRVGKSLRIKLPADQSEADTTASCLTKARTSHESASDTVLTKVAKWEQMSHKQLVRTVSPADGVVHKGFESPPMVSVDPVAGDEDEDDRMPCRISPTRVKEEPDMARTRHVGREAAFEATTGLHSQLSGKLVNQSPPLPSVPLERQSPSPPGASRYCSDSDSVLNTTASDYSKHSDDCGGNLAACRKEATAGAATTADKEEYSHDSGMYDTVPPAQAELSCSKDVQVEAADHRPPYRDSGLPDTQGLVNRTSLLYVRSTSMFDEYFQDDGVSEDLGTVPLCGGCGGDVDECDRGTEPSTTSGAEDELDGNVVSPAVHPEQLIRVPPKRSKSNADRLKRLASIEGSNSIFDEYMNVPCPEVGVRISEGSELSSRASAQDGRGRTVMDDDIVGTSMFDEYFNSESDVVVLPAPPTTTATAASAPPHRSGDEAQSGHLADRRKATRPECLLMKTAAKKEGETTTPRPRQLSGQSTATLTPARTRSVTPTELGRRRHASTLSDGSNLEPDFFFRLKDVDMPSCEMTEDSLGAQSFHRNFGRSLLAGFSPKYLSDFVLHGTSDTNFQAKLHNDLTMSVKNSVLDEQIAEAVCLVADIDNWSVRQMSCPYGTADRVKSQEVAASPLVCNIIESVHDLWKLKMSPEFCLMHLEDRLQEIYFKSRTLAEYIRLQKRVNINVKHLATMLKLDVNDIPLLLAVAGTHTPHLTMAPL